MRRAVGGWPGWLLLAAAALTLLLVGYQRAAQPLNADQRVQAIAERLACPVCEGESVAESRSPAARTIRDDIVKYVNAGQLTDDQIVNKIDDASVKDLRLTPRNTGLDLLVWFLPAMMSAAAAAGLAVAFRRWRRPVAASGPSDDDRRLVAAALQQAEGDVIR